jgi:hypothetical protein
MSPIAKHLAKRAEAKRSLSNLRVLKSANAPILLELGLITGATEQEASDNRQKAIKSVIKSAR